MQQLGAVDPRTDMAAFSQYHCNPKHNPNNLPPEHLNFKCIPEPLHHYLVLLRYFPARHSLVWPTALRRSIASNAVVHRTPILACDEHVCASMQNTCASLHQSSIHLRFDSHWSSSRSHAPGPQSLDVFESLIEISTRSTRTA